MNDLTLFCFSNKRVNLNRYNHEETPTSGLELEEEKIEGQKKRIIDYLSEKMETSQNDI